MTLLEAHDALVEAQIVKNAAEDAMSSAVLDAVRRAIPALSWRMTNTASVTTDGTFGLTWALAGWSAWAVGPDVTRDYVTADGATPREALEALEKPLRRVTVRAARDARAALHDVLEDAVDGKATVISRHGRAAGVVVPVGATPEEVLVVLQAARGVREGRLPEAP